MAQSIFIPKTPEVLPDATPVTDAPVQVAQGMGGVEILVWIIG